MFEIGLMAIKWQFPAREMENYRTMLVTETIQGLSAHTDTQTHRWRWVEVTWGVLSVWLWRV